MRLSNKSTFSLACLILAFVAVVMAHTITDTMLRHHACTPSSMVNNLER